jgi:hypothetical protein
MLAATTQVIILPFEVDTQEATNWCWAAVATSVARYYLPSSSLRQCDVVDHQLGLKDCCTSSPPPEHCNEPEYTENALEYVGHFDSKRGIVAYNDVVAALEKLTPPCIRIGWPDEGGHSIGVSGCQPDSELLFVSDPSSGGSIVTYQALTTGHYRGSGKWTDTYLTKENASLKKIGEKIASAPFVAGGWVYFRGTKDELFRVKTDGSGSGQWIGNNTTKSTPFVTPDGWVWFQGTGDGADGNRLWKMRTDGTERSNPGRRHTYSSPVVVGDWVYFQWQRNFLWRMRTNGDDPKVIGRDAASASAPFVADGWVYFRGTKDELFRVKTDGTGSRQWINNNTTKSTPFVTPDGWVWFQGTGDGADGNKLWKVRTDGTHQSNPGNNKTLTSPTVFGDWVYFQGTGSDIWLWRMVTNGTAQGRLRNSNNDPLTTLSTPFVTSDSIYFRNENNLLYCYLLSSPPALPA